MYLKVEAWYAAAAEGALHLEDILARRMRISIEYPHRGVDCAREVAEVVAPVLGWSADDVDREVATYLARVDAEVLSQTQPDDESADALRAAAPEARAEILEPVPTRREPRRPAPLPVRRRSRARAGAAARRCRCSSSWPTASAKQRPRKCLREKWFAPTAPSSTAATVLPPDAQVYLYRDLPDEVPVPFDIPVLHRDENIVVVDKPHFLATMPRGGHVAQTALVRLRRALDLPELSPAHRLDRLTAGVLMFTVRREVRGAYQTMFARGEVRKTYLARAAVAPSSTFRLVVRSRIIKQRGRLQAFEEPGEANAETLVEHARRTGCTDSPRGPAARISYASTWRRSGCRY